MTQQGASIAFPGELGWGKVSKVPEALLLQKGERYSGLELFLPQEALKTNVSKRILLGKERTLIRSYNYITHTVYILSHKWEKKNYIRQGFMLRTLG